MNANLAYVYDEDLLVDFPSLPKTATESLVLIQDAADAPQALIATPEEDDACCNLYLIPA